MRISQRKHEAQAAGGGPERHKRRECQSCWRERCASQVQAGQPMPGLPQPDWMRYTHGKIGWPAES